MLENSRATQIVIGPSDADVCIDIANLHENAATRIQTAYRRHLKRIADRDLKEIRRGSEAAVCVFQKGIASDSNLVLLKVMHLPQTRRLLLLLRDISRRTMKTITIDNYDYDYDSTARDRFLERISKDLHLPIADDVQNIELHDSQNGSIALLKDHQSNRMRGRSLRVLQDFQTIHQTTKQFGTQEYHLTMTLDQQGHVEVHICPLSESSRIDQTLPLSYNMRRYLDTATEVEKQEFGEQVATWLFLHPTQHELCLDYSKVESAVAQFCLRERDSKAASIQRACRKWLQRNKEQRQQELQAKDWEMLLQQGVKLEDRYHIFKVLLQKSNRGRVRILSNQAVNKIELPVSTIFPKAAWAAVQANRSDMQKLFRHNIGKVVGFQPSSKTLHLVVPSSPR